ncbi:hypothetical protein L9F63_005574, partial [Diploptera punctata]
HNWRVSCSSIFFKVVSGLQWATDNILPKSSSILAGLLLPWVELISRRRRRTHNLHITFPFTSHLANLTNISVESNQHRCSISILWLVFGMKPYLKIYQ